MSGYSLDLRERVVHNWQNGKTQEWIATTFEISLSSVKRYIGQYRRAGHIQAKQQAYKQPTIRDEQLPLLSEQLQTHDGATVAQHVALWQAQTGQVVNTSMMWRAIDRAGWTRKKKTLGAKERDEGERLLFKDMAHTLVAEQVVVLDESSTHLDMTSAYARAPKGDRAYAKVLRNYGSNVSLIAALRLSGMVAPWVVEGSVNTPVFEAYIEHILAPTLHHGDIVIMDNLAPHHASAVRDFIQARGACLLFLPAYSPDLSPIEKAFSKLKAFLRRKPALTFDTLLDAIAQALQTISPTDAIGYFSSCGFLNIS